MRHLPRPFRYYYLYLYQICECKAASRINNTAKCRCNRRCRQRRGRGRCQDVQDLPLHCCGRLRQNCHRHTFAVAYKCNHAAKQYEYKYYTQYNGECFITFRAAVCCLVLFCLSRHWLGVHAADVYPCK